VSLLIIGGLLVFALLAIIGAVLLSMREQRTEKIRVGANAPARASIQKPTQQAPIRSSNSAVPEKAVPATVDEQTLVMLNGQFHEFAVELRSLHQQAWNLEQRLRGLTEMVDRIEESRASRIHVEEEALSRSDESE
jgi:hypothetical protein